MFRGKKKPQLHFILITFSRTRTVIQRRVTHGGKDGAKPHGMLMEILTKRGSRLEVEEEEEDVDEME